MGNRPTDDPGQPASAAEGNGEEQAEQRDRWLDALINRIEGEAKDHDSDVPDTEPPTSPPSDTEPPTSPPSDTEPPTSPPSDTDERRETPAQPIAGPGSPDEQTRSPVDDEEPGALETMEPYDRTFVDTPAEVAAQSKPQPELSQRIDLTEDLDDLVEEIVEIEDIEEIAFEQAPLQQQSSAPPPLPPRAQRGPSAELPAVSSAAVPADEAAAAPPSAEVSVEAALPPAADFSIESAPSPSAEIPRGEVAGSPSIEVSLEIVAPPSREAPVDETIPAGDAEVPFHGVTPPSAEVSLEILAPPSREGEDAAAQDAAAQDAAAQDAAAQDAGVQDAGVQDAATQDAAAQDAAEGLIFEPFVGAPGDAEGLDAPSGPEAEAAQEMVRERAQARAADDLAEERLLQAVEDAREADPRELAALLEIEIEAQPDGRARAFLQHDLGHLLQWQRGDEEAALDAYRKALDLAPDLRPNLWALRHTLTRAQRWDDLLKLLDAQILFGEQVPRGKAELLYDKGILLEQRLDDPAGARECFWAAHVADKSWLAPLLALETLARDQGDLGALVDVHQRMAETATDPARKVAVWRDLARLRQQLPEGSAEAALETLEQALALGFDTEALLHHMDLIATRAGLAQQRISVLQRLAEQSGTAPASAAGYLWQAAQLHIESGELEQARALMARVGDLAGEDPLVEQACLDLAERTEDWSEVIRQLQVQLEQAGEPIEQAAIWHRIARAHHRSGNDNAAADALDHALDLVAGYLPALVERERQALEQDNLGMLRAVAVAEAEAAAEGSPGLPGGANPKWAAFAWWRAAFYSRQQGSMEQAIDDCGQALAVDPDNELVRRELSDLLRHAGQHEELAHTLSEQAAAAGGGRRIRLLEQLAQLQGGPLADRAGQLATLRQLAELQPDDTAATRRLADAQLDGGDFAEATQTLARLEQMTEDPQTVRSLKLQRAGIEAGPLGNARAAIDLCREVLQDTPEDSQAVAVLDVLLRQQGAHEELAAVLQQAAEASTGEARTALLLELGHLRAWKLPPSDQTTEQAIEAYAQVLASHPDDLVVGEKLIRLCYRAGHYARAAELLEGQARNLEHPALKVEALIRAAELLRDRLDQPQRAEALFQQAVELAPDDRLPVPAIDALAQAHLARGDYLEGLRWLDRLGEGAPEGARQLLLAERARISDGPLDDPSRARSLYRELLQSDPSHKAAWLAELAAAAGNRDAGAMVTALGPLASACSETAVAAALHARSATLATSTSAAPDDADSPPPSVAYRATLEHAPADIEALLGLLGEETEASERADLLDRLAAALPPSGATPLRLLRAASALEAGRIAAARDLIADVLQEDAESLPALLLLQQCASASNDPMQEARIWLRIATLVAEPKAKGEAFRRAAALLEAEGDAKGAAIAYRQVVAIAPDEEVQQKLRAIYQDLSDYHGLDELLSTRIAVTDDRGALIGLYFERAELRMQHMDDLRGAARDLLKILELDDKHLEALRQLARLYDEDGGVERAVELYGRYLRATESISLKRQPAQRLANLLAEHGRLAEAVDVCQRFLEQAPEDDAVLGQLAELYVKIRDFPHAVQTLDKLGRLRPDKTWRAANLCRIARIYRDQMHDLKGARETLWSALELDPTNLEIIDELRRAIVDTQQDVAESKKQIDVLLDRAKDDIREALGADTLSVDLYQRLLTVAEWDVDQHTLLATLGVLCYLNAANPEDRELYQRRVATLSFEPKRGIDPLTWRESVVARGARTGFTEIWGVIADAAAKLHSERIPLDAAALGLGRGDRVDRRSGGPVSAAVNRIAQALALTEFEIYLSRKDPRVVAGLAGKDTALVIGHEMVSSLDNPANRFQVGRVLAMLRDRTLLLEKLKLSDLRLLMASAVFLVEPGATFDLPRPDVEQGARRLGKVLSRKAHRALPLAVSRLMHEAAGLEQWLRGQRTTANRAGLLVCGDVIAAMDQLVPTLRDRHDRTSESIVDELRQHQEASELLIYSVSRQYLDVRRELKL